MSTFLFMSGSQLNVFVTTSITVLDAENNTEPSVPIYKLRLCSMSFISLHDSSLCKTMNETLSPSTIFQHRSLLYVSSLMNFPTISVGYKTISLSSVITSVGYELFRFKGLTLDAHHLALLPATG